MKAIIYLRVSTQKQGQSGLGIEAQRDMCQQYVYSQNGEIICEYSDTESGKNRERKGLWDAINHCKDTGATLVVAKLDRLARDVEFTFKIINTGVNIHFCDMPMVNTMILGVFASVAQYERELISSRTKAALTAKKQRGEKWGNGGANIEKAQAVSAEKRIQRAKDNPENIFFKNYILMFEERNSKLEVGCDQSLYDKLASELNAIGKKTLTGLDYNKTRCRALVYKMKQRYRI